MAFNLKASFGRRLYEQLVGEPKASFYCSTTTCLIEKRYTLLLTGGDVTGLSSPQKEPCVRQFVESVNVFCKEENI